MARLVCYMYYTDVFVGHNNINNLKKALNVELKDSVNSIDLTQLVHGLCLFLGYPSCVCKPKKSVEESLRKISEELNEEVENYKCLSKPSLNCDSCSTSVVCKCCVLDCITKVQSCKCVKGGRNNCQCSSVDPKRCCKDLLEKLKASLSLLNLKADMEICKCNDVNCCVDGECTQKGSSTCTVCINLKTSKDYTVTGLGLLRPSPKRLAERLEGFFGDSSKTSKSGCTCKCGTSDPSCCCLACQDCSESCNSECLSKGSSHGSSQDCPCKDFCSKINSIKVASGSSLMKCCNKGNECHCGLTSGSNCSGDCCKEPNKQSLKCMIRRLVSYFKELETSSSSTSYPYFFKSCCDLLCVVKCCEFLRDFYNKRNKDVCGTCKKGGKGISCNGSKGPGTCCEGSSPDCGSSSGSCKTCPECQQICYAKDFFKALEKLKLSSPCGQDLYRVLKDFLECCGRLHGSLQYVENKLRKPIQTCQCKTLKPGQPCSCCSSVTSSSSGNCQGCQELSKDSKLRSVLLSQYVSSSYDSSAKWEDLCKSQPCCQPSCLQCSPPSSCPPGGCCEKCPKRLCAKIFLGILPCLYYGLKILHDRSKYDSGFAGWHDITMDSKGKPSSGLAKFFQAWGYGLRPLISKKGSEFSCILEYLFGSDKIFEKLLDLVSKKYFTSSSSGSSSPSTVREILLWLYGLPFTSGFHDLVSHCSLLCSPFGNSFNADAFCYYIYTCSFILPVSVISFIQLPDGSPSFLPSPSDWEDFCYPEDPSELLEKLCEYVRKIYIPLKFLQYQCDRDKNSAGWQECFFGQNCSVDSGSGSSVSSTSGCGCKGHDKYLCTGSSGHSGKCSSCTAKCPHPLMAFLIDGSENSKNLKNLESLFKPPPGFPKMGFKNLSSTAKSGYSLHHGVLTSFCQDGFYPLTRLVQFAFWVSRYPETLGELFAFFFRFSESDVFKNFGDYVDGEPGSYPGKALQDAVQGFYGSEDSHKISSHPSDLRSLIACPATKESRATCGKYLHPLTYNAYHGFIEGFLGTYLSWICYSAEKFKEKLKGFYNEASEKFSCCSTGSCEKIVTCPCALPFLYSFGFGFWSPKGLNDNNKKCSDFIDQLRFVIWGKPSTPLSKLLEEIERFIWSIRLPFFLFILAFWAFVISYFLYVQLYKLDLLHLKSHAHFSRSFKILPSTLFSDASSKLKDLSYFTL
ncbi:variant erythrocyte surface antigen-1 family protein [Babesia divergens]|uniref:Variant erythrocyte surface antigen-1 family protein n=1 Tax=Babesia divergens TaxID=32595 RepID=A0AAD9G5E7_BABDI|nr:variant erythrocyte surface antigen-1 family protein [Babesia divergens]